MKSRVLPAIALLLVMAAGVLLAPPARADSQVRIVRLSLVDGPVQIDRATGQGFEKAIMNMPITQGMRISTPGDARAEVEFENGTTLRLAPRTEIGFPQLGLRSSGARFTAVEVSQGTAYFDVRHKGDDEFRVAFANREIGINRNVHFRLDMTGGNPELAVFKGELEVQGPQERAKVKKDETLTFDLADAGRYDLARTITPEPYDTWDNERLNYVSQYASGSYNTHSPYYYGASDLNYYGSWSSYPGYGTLWRPFGVGYGWDPFYNGAWCWYPGFGYTWVSTYPWGWTPYRYGSWVFVPGFGWAWQPGVWNTWTTVPPVYNAPPAFHRPRPPMPVAVVEPGGTTTPHPTVVVDNGVTVIRNPRIYKAGEDPYERNRHIPTPTTGFAPPTPGSTTVVVPPSRAVAPATSTGVTVPNAVAPDRNPGTYTRPRRGDPDDIRVKSPGRGGPAPQVQRSAPPAPHVDHSARPPRVERPAPPPKIERPATAPRVERSAPPPRMSAPPARMSVPAARPAPESRGEWRK